jgi:hypothetical protein
MVTVLAYGCLIQAIVHAYALDERTVARWRERVGKHCKHVHEAIVQQGPLDLIQVQADEIRVKGRRMIAWMGWVMRVSTRLWVAGVVSQTCDTHLADRLVHQVRACRQPVRAARLHRWVGVVSGQHSSSFPRKSEKDEWQRKILLGGMA